MTGEQVSTADSKAILKQATDSVPVRQRWLPQTSIRFFGFIIALCAVAMVAFRAAAVSGNVWAKITSLLIGTTIGCFVAYATLFLLAYLFSSATGLLWSSFSKTPTSDSRYRSDHS